MYEKLEYIKDEKERSFYIKREELIPLKQELEDFLKSESYMNTLDFSKKVMPVQEVKNNNHIEGYRDDVSSIEKIIENAKEITDDEKRNRVINLYKGYNYILKSPKINKENLKELYDILSKELLSKEDLSNMGPYYREKDVYIFYSSNLEVAPDKGADPKVVEPLMENYFNYLNKSSDIYSMTDYYEKAQIAHFYFIYIHPYFDINGRTARTSSMWYLLNNEAYPYIIFNRAIGNSKNTYYRQIRSSKANYNLTHFLKYLMVNVKKELEKEYVIQGIKANAKEPLTSIDITTILDILSMNGLLTLKDYATVYNGKNDKKRVTEIHDEMINPLLEKNIIQKVRTTNNMYTGEDNNYVFKLNTDNLDIDKSKIRRIKI